jgi:hypothetical protein
VKKGDGTIDMILADKNKGEARRNEEAVDGGIVIA